jgi:uncharacterized protein (TIGR03083 family)
VTLDRSEALAGIPVGLGGFGALLAALTDRDLGTPTRCAGWTVGDVAGHVVGTVVDVTQGRLEGQGTPPVTERQARERSGHTGRQMADELAVAAPALTALLASLPEEAWAGPAPHDPAYTLGFAVEAIWFDTYLHADDIHDALGRPSVRGDGLRCAVHHVAGYLEQRGWPPTTLALTGLETVDVAGGGPRIVGDPLQFVLAATGRIDPVAAGFDPGLNVYAELGDPVPRS